MGTEFYQTRMGANFFQNQLPSLTKAINRLADATEANLAKGGEVPADAKYANLESLIQKVKATRMEPDESGVDADTIFADHMESVEWDVSEQVDELLGLYDIANCKADFDKLFAFFTGISFEEFLKLCLN